MLNRPQLGRDVFARGLPEPIAEIKKPEWSATLYDLLSAYAGQRQKQARSYVRMPKRTVWSLAEAREALERLIGQATDWRVLDEYLIAYMVEPSHAATVRASSFAATLELVREGRLELHQQAAFAPLYVRKRQEQRSGGVEWNPEMGMDEGEAGMIANVAEMRVIGGKRAEETRAEELRILEALLFAADEPLDEKALAARLPAGVDVRALLTQLQKEYAPRGVNLVRVGGKWSLRTAGDLAWLLTRETVVTKKLSRAAIETLAIVAYHQPVTRAEIEEIRGVTTSKGTLDVLLGDRLDPVARPPQGARPAGDLRHHRGIHVAFRPGCACRSSRPRRAQGRRPDRQIAAGRVLRAGAVRRPGIAGGRGPARTRGSRFRARPAAGTHRGIALNADFAASDAAGLPALAVKLVFAAFDA